MKKQNKTAEKMQITIIILLIATGLWCPACDFVSRKNTEPKIAEVNGKVLYLSDVRDIFPIGIYVEDSLAFLKNYVTQWARKQLIADIAEQHLDKKQKDVSHELEDYRLSLLIFRYEQLYLEKRSNATVSDAEIESYYIGAPQNFILSKPIAKVLFIKISENIPQKKKISQLFYSTKAEDRELLLRTYSGIAEICTNFDEKWITAESLSQELPIDVRQVEKMWEKNSFSLQLAGYSYFVHLYEKRAAGELSPLEYEKEKITQIIRNRRNQEMLKTLENTIYNNALNHNQLKIYIDNLICTNFFIH